MGATASLSVRSIAVEPGATATLEITVRNTGAVVDQFDLTVVGDAEGWTTVEPPSISLFPGAEGVALVLVSPPRDAGIPAGPVPFGIKVASREDPQGSVVEEATAQIGTFRDLTAELVPRASRGRRAAHHDVALDNRGNATVQTSLSAVPDDELVFAFDPPALAPEPGTASFARVRVSARRRFLKGPPVSRPFQVLVESDDHPPMAVDGTLVQQPILPPWAMKALLALLLACLVLAVLWLKVLKPSIKSAAKDAVQEQLAPIAKDAAAAKSAAAKAATDAKAAQDAAEHATGTSVPVPTTQPVLAATRGSTVDGRLFLTKPGVATFVVPDGMVLEITDLVLQNPDASAGTLNLRRNGTPLLVVTMENFRDLDYHFVTPLVFKAGEKLELAADCKTPPGTCTPGAYYSGTMKKA